MKLKNTILAGMLTVATIAFVLATVLGLGISTPFAANTPLTVNAVIVVSPTCFIGLTNSVVQFEPLSPTQNTVQVWNGVTDYDNGGDVATSFVLISAGIGNALNAQTGNGVWIGISKPGDVNTIVVSNTEWAPSASNTYAGVGAVALSSVLTVMTGVTVSQPTAGTPNTMTTIFLGMGIPAAQQADTYTTNVVIENSC